MSANTAMPAIGNSCRTDLRTISEYEISVISGTRSASGPLVIDPNPIAAQASTGRSSQNARIATVVQNASALSMIVVRAYARTSGIVASASAASQPVSGPQRRVPNHTTTISVASVHRYAGNRAAVSVGPSTSMLAAAAAK